MKTIKALTLILPSVLLMAATLTANSQESDAPMSAAEEKAMVTEGLDNGWPTDEPFSNQRSAPRSDSVKLGEGLGVRELTPEQRVEWEVWKKKHFELLRAQQAVIQVQRAAERAAAGTPETSSTQEERPKKVAPTDKPTVNCPQSAAVAVDRCAETIDGRNEPGNN